MFAIGLRRVGGGRKGGNAPSGEGKKGRVAGALPKVKSGEKKGANSL